MIHLLLRLAVAVALAPPAVALYVQPDPRLQLAGLLIGAWPLVDGAVLVVQALRDWPRIRTARSGRHRQPTAHPYAGAHRAMRPAMAVAP